MAELVLVNSAGTSQSFPLGEAPLLIGRHASCHVQLWDPKVSREHSRIEKRPDGYYLLDLNSRNGSHVNGVPVTTQRLAAGDQIKIGDAQFTFVVEGAVSFTEPGKGGPVTMVDRSLRPQDARLLNEARATPDTATVHNAQMAVEVFQRLARLSTSAQEPGPLVEGAMDLAMELVGADRGFICVAGAKPQSFVVKASRPKSSTAGEISLSKTILEHTVQKGEAILCGDIQSDSRFTAQASVTALRMKSAIYVPIKVQDLILGILGVDTPNPNKRFSAEHLNFLTIFSNHLAVALQNMKFREDAERQKRIEAELQMAREIQTRFLPMEPIPVKGIEYAAKMLPATYVGGDFYDWMLLKDGRIAFTIGDVSGKGVPAALSMARIMGCLRGMASALDNPADILKYLNKSLFDTESGGMFTTIALAIFDAPSRTLDLSMAGHLPPIIFSRKNTQGEILSADFGLPLGILSDTEWTRAAMRLGKNDLVIFYTDGIVEAKAKAPDIEALRRVIQKTVDAPLNQIIETILSTVAPEETRHDDATLLALRVL